MGNEGKIILDNGGGITLQMGEFARYYDNVGAAASDLADWLVDADTSTWDGHEDDAMDCNPTPDEIRNGGYRVVRLDREVDTLASLADELDAIKWGNGDDLAKSLRHRDPKNHAHPVDLA